MNRQLKRLNKYLQYTGPKRTKTKKWQWKIKPGDIVITNGAGKSLVKLIVFCPKKYDWQYYIRHGYILVKYTDKENNSCYWWMERRFVKAKIKIIK